MLGKAWYDRAMNVNFSVAELLSSSTRFVFVWEPNAYQDFSNGIPLIEEGGFTLLNQFYEKNKAEFWGDQMVGSDSGFRHFVAEGKSYYFTFHKHKTKEEHSKRLWELEAMNSEPGSN